MKQTLLLLGMAALLAACSSGSLPKPHGKAFPINAQTGAKHVVR